MALTNRRVRIGDLLIADGLITDDQLNIALKQQKERKTKLGETLIAMGYITPGAFAKVLSEQLGIESVYLTTTKIDHTALHLISEELMKKYELLPFAFDEHNANNLKVAMADPMNLNAVDDVELITNMTVIPYFATTEQIAFQIDKYFGKKQVLEAAEQFRQEHADELKKDRKSTRLNSSH